MKYELWYIENPVSKELTKRITLKLGPNSQQEFVVVVKCPGVKRPENLLSQIKVGLLTYPHEQFGKRDSFEEHLKTRYESSMRQFLNDRKRIAQIQSTSVLIAAKLTIPKLVCCKQFALKRPNSGDKTGLTPKIIPIAVRRQSGVAG